MKAGFLQGFVVAGLLFMPLPAYAQIDKERSNSEAYRMRDKQPPALTRGDLSTDPVEIMNNSSEATMDSVRDHFKHTYGTEEGPFAKIREQEKELAAARKRVARYGMTQEERQAADEAERLAAQDVATEEEKEKEKEEERAKGYIYNRDEGKGDIPPRLFNNVTR